KMAWLWVAGQLIVILAYLNIYEIIISISSLIHSYLLGYAFISAIIGAVQGISLGIVVSLLVWITNNWSHLQIVATHTKPTTTLDTPQGDTLSEIEYSDDESLATLQHQARTGD